MKTLMLLLVLTSCSSPKYGDYALKKKEAPQFLIRATPSGAHISDVEYFIERTPEITTYELEYEDNGHEVSITFSESGEFIEKEEDIPFASIPKASQEKIRQYLSTRFPHYRIHETEIRTDKSQQTFYEVEIIHPGGKTGYTEFSFTTTGEYVSEKVEPLSSIETLN